MITIKASDSSDAGMQLYELMTVMKKGSTIQVAVEVATGRPDVKTIHKNDRGDILIDGKED